MQVTFAQQPVGDYTLRIDATQVKDRVGNALGTAPVDTHFTIRQFSVEWIAARETRYTQLAQKPCESRMVPQESPVAR